MHKRLRPKRHALSYRVFSMLLDTDELASGAAKRRLFSVNRFNLFAFHDKDHGPGTGVAAGAHARGLFAEAGIGVEGGRVLILCYPRVFGYVFNPISVYYGFDKTGRLAGFIYEVNNTWGERRSYVAAAGQPSSGVYAQEAVKAMAVSPFASPNGRYGFRVTAPGDGLVLGIQFSDAAGALIKTHFKASAEPFADRVLAGLLFRFPLLTLKVIGAIHWEALKLWLKGVPLAGGKTTPGYAVTYVGIGKVGAQ